MMNLEDAKEALDAASGFLEVHAQSNKNPRTLRIHHELDIQVQRLEEIIEDLTLKDGKGEKQN